MNEMEGICLGEVGMEGHLLQLSGVLQPSERGQALFSHVCEGDSIFDPLLSLFLGHRVPRSPKVYG